METKVLSCAVAATVGHGSVAAEMPLAGSSPRAPGPGGREIAAAEMPLAGVAQGALRSRGRRIAAAEISFAG